MVSPFRRRLPIFLIPFVIAFLVVGVGTLSGSGSRWWGLLALVGFGGCLYMVGWLLAYELVVDDDTLRWRGLVRHGQVQVADLTSIKYGLAGIVFRDRRGGKVYMPPEGDLEPVIRRIVERNPAVVVDIPQRVRQRLRQP